MENNKNEITIQNKIKNSPSQIVEYAQQAAKQLKEIVEKSGWVSRIKNKDYLQFEGWQTLARFYGLTVKTKSSNYVKFGNTEGFEAKSEVINKDGVVVGGAEAMCLNDEPNWKGKPLFSLRSMAQTRACAKALRQLLSWVVVLAGYKPSPAEEVSEDLISEDDNEKKQIKQYFCYECETPITEKIRNYSIKKYNTALCMKCQKNYEAKSEKFY